MYAGEAYDTKARLYPGKKALYCNIGVARRTAYVGGDIFNVMIPASSSLPNR